MKRVVNRPDVPSAKSFGGTGLLSFAAVASSNKSGRRKYPVSSRVLSVIGSVRKFRPFHHSLLII
jgi:hypothetical protein